MNINLIKNELQNSTHLYIYKIPLNALIQRKAGYVNLPQSILQQSRLCLKMRSRTCISWLILPKKGEETAILFLPMLKLSPGEYCVCEVAESLSDSLRPHGL